MSIQAYSIEREGEREVIMSDRWRNEEGRTDNVEHTDKCELLGGKKTDHGY